MATSKSLTACIDNNASAKTRKRLPQIAIDAASENSGRKDLMEASLKQHLEALRTIRKDVTEKYNTATDLVAASAQANTLTNREDDVLNELGTFQPVARRKLLDNLVQRYKTFSAAMKVFFKKEGATAEDKAALEHFQNHFHRDALRSMQKLFKYKEGTSHMFRREDPMQFIPQRKRTTIQTPKGKKDIWILDPVTYLDDEGNPLKNAQGNPITSSLDPEVTSAIAATAYEWLGSESTRKAFGQTQQTMRQFLGLDKEDAVPKTAWDHLGDSGMHTNTLAQSLGRSIRERIGIRDTVQSDALAQRRLELSLGYMAIATMEDMGLVERQEVYTGQLSKEEISRRQKEVSEIEEKAKAAKKKPVYPEYELNAGDFGLAALKNGNDQPKERVIYEPKVNDAGEDTSPRKGYPTTKLTRIKSIQAHNKRVPLPRIEEIKGYMDVAPAAFDKIFGTDASPKNIHWGKIKLPEKMRIGRSHLTAVDEQKNNIKKYVDIRYEGSTTLDIFKAMLEAGTVDSGVQEIFETMLGWQDPATQMAAFEKSIEGSNREVQNAVTAVKDFIRTAELREAKGEDTSFTVNTNIIGNMRMMMQGLIDPQNSKIHRNLFSPKGWKAAFTPNYQVKVLRNKQGLDRAFHEALAMAFDIESGKVGGVDQQLDKLDHLLRVPDKLDADDHWKHGAIQGALSVLREFYSNQERGSETARLTAEQMRIVAEGVQATGTKAHGLKGLVEYARYQNHQKTPAKQRKEFTSDLYNEIDGVSNGVMISLLQFIPNHADFRTVLSMLALGGMNVGTEEKNLDHLLADPLLNDAYQRMGQIWSRDLIQLKQRFDQDRNDSSLEDKQRAAAEKNYHRSLAIGRIMGKFQDDNGVVKKFVRNLAKPRTMQTSYGAGIYRQAMILANSDLINDGIYGQIQELIDNPPTKEFPNGKSRGQVRTEFSRLLEDINTLTGANYTVESYLNNEGYLSREKMRKFQLSEQQETQINKAVLATYGKAMESTISEIYQPLIDARKPFVSSVQLAITTYNAILTDKIKTAIDLKKSLNKDNTKKDGDFSLTNEEVNQILEEMEEFFPKIRTPLNDKESFLPLATKGKDKKFSLSREVEQIYNSGTLQRHRGTADGIPFLDSAGAAPAVVSIQMIDAMIANDLMGSGIEFVNAHDGFPHSFRDSAAVRDRVNQRFAEVITNYNLGEEFSKMNTLLSQKGLEEIERRELPYDQLAEAMFADGVIDVTVTAQLAFLDTDAINARIAALREAGGYVMSKEVATQQVLRDLTKNISRKELVQSTFQIIQENVSDMSDQVTRNKKEVTDSVTEWAQYPYQGKGITVDSVSDRDHVFHPGIKRDNILPLDAESTKKLTEDIREFKDTEYYSSPEGKVSTTRSDYLDSSVVDSLNVSQVLDTMVALDNQAPYARVSDSPEQLAHLKRILDDVVANVMTPVELFRRDKDEPTQGLYTVDSKNGNKIWMQVQKTSEQPKPGMLTQGIRMSAAEVYAHEMVHHITHAALKNQRFLRRQAYDVFEAARDAFEQRYGSTAFRVFMNDPYADLNDSANAFEIMAAKERWKYVFEGDHRRIDEFLAYGMTNENFRGHLASVEIDDKTLRKRKSLAGILEQDLQTTVANLFNRIMDFFHQTFFQQKHSGRADQEVENLVRTLSEVEGRNKTGIFKALMELEENATALAVKGNEKIKEKTHAVMQHAAVGRVITNIRELKDADTFISHKIRMALNWYNDSEQGLLASIVTEMEGTTERLKPLHKLLNRRNRVLDAAKLEATRTMRAVVNNAFTKELEPATKVAVTKAMLKTDLSSLLGPSSFDSIKDFLTDPTKREDRIKHLVQEMAKDPELAPHRHFFEKAADDLGYYMITSAARPDGVPLMNAHNIAKMMDLPSANALKGEAFQRAVSLIDQLATLSSLRYVRTDQLRGVSQLMEDYPGNMEDIMGHHNLLKERALIDSFNGSPALMQKGYTKQILNDRIRYEQGTIHDKARFESMGYVMQETPIKRDPKDPVQDDIYMFKSVTGTVNDYQPGIMSITNNAMKGTSQYKLQLQIGNNTTAGQAALANNQKVAYETKKKLRAMYSSTPRPTRQSQGTENYMVPKMDISGRIDEMRYVMNEHTKDTVLQQFSEFDAVLAAMSSQIIDKKYTPQINAEVVTALKDLYDSEFHKYPEAYVEISAQSDNPRYRDIWHMLPIKTKQQVESVWGAPRMMVSRDVIDLAFGQRKFSITEMFAKDRKDRKLFEAITTDILTFALGANNPFTDAPLNTAADDDAETARNKRLGRATTRAKRIEETMTQLTKIGKSNIVVRNINVTYGNYVSNMAYLKSKGITLERISKLSREAINSALDYQKVKHELNTLRLQRDVTRRNTSLAHTDKAQRLKKLDRRIERLEHELANNPSTDMINAGLMPQVVDDVDTAHVQSPHKYGVDAFIDRNLAKLPNKLERVSRTLFMTEDTEGYKMLNNGVKMTDYTARYVLYTHYRSQGMKHDDAISKAIDEFINFDLPTHRSIEYLNSVGILWFSKYQLRVLKQIKNLVLEHPFTTLATFLMGAYMGGHNIINSIPGITKDTFQAFGDPITALSGSADQILYADLVGTVASSTLN